MKELSIEEKAKVYDKVIEIINDYYQKIKYSSVSSASTDREVLESAFPELKESEDERIREDIISLVNKWWKDDGAVTPNFSTRAEMLAWLEKPTDTDSKFLRKQQQWSEEDEELFEEIKRCVGIQYPLGNPCIFKFLKSLKGRYTWKPTEEQMIAIQEAMNIVGVLTITGSKINSLYQDLKKLRKD